MLESEPDTVMCCSPKLLLEFCEEEIFDKSKSDRNHLPINCALEIMELELDSVM